jgi:fructokinase
MPHITSIGEILFDIYEDSKKLGGAPFNFIYHIIKLTGRGNIISRVGNDENGKEILKFLEDKDISSAFIQKDNIHQTGLAIANLNENKVPDWSIEQNCAYDFIENKNNINRLLEGTDCIYFGTLAQRNKVSRETIQSLFNRQVKYFCDLNIRQKFYTKEIIDTSVKAADVLKINEDELILLNKLFINEPYELVSTSVKVKNYFDIDTLCVTSGEKGSYLFRLEEIDYCKPSIGKPVDTVGAGDAYAAILCIGYLKNWELKKLNKTASDFAGEIIKIKGALPPDDELYSKFKIMD